MCVPIELAPGFWRRKNTIAYVKERTINPYGSTGFIKINTLLFYFHNLKFVTSKTPAFYPLSILYRYVTGHVYRLVQKLCERIHLIRTKQIPSRPDRRQCLATGKSQSTDEFHRYIFTCMYTFIQWELTVFDSYLL